MEQNNDPRWSKNPSLHEMENLMENMNEAMDLFGQLMKEKLTKLISIQNKLREKENGRT